MRRLQQSRAKNRRLRAFLRVEILIARAEGETVRFPHRWASDDFDRKIEIAHHSANDGELLKILFSKDRGVRLERDETVLSPRCRRRENVRAAKRRRASPRATFSSTMSRTIIGIHFVRRRAKENVHALGPTDFFVRRFRPRITRKIRARLELQRVHEDADRHFARRCRRVARASRISEMCPACSAPIVGTSTRHVSLVAGMRAQLCHGGR